MDLTHPKFWTQCGVRYFVDGLVDTGEENLVLDLPFFENDRAEEEFRKETVRLAYRLIDANDGFIDTRPERTDVAACRRRRPCRRARRRSRSPPRLRTSFLPSHSSLRAIEGVRADALFESSVAAELDGVVLRVISLDDLVRNERVVARPRDLDDADFLERVPDAPTVNPD